MGKSEMIYTTDVKHY